MHFRDNSAMLFSPHHNNHQQFITLIEIAHYKDIVLIKLSWCCNQQYLNILDMYPYYRLYFQQICSVIRVHYYIHANNWLEELITMIPDIGNHFICFCQPWWYTNVNVHIYLVRGKIYEFPCIYLEMHIFPFLLLLQLGKTAQVFWIKYCFVINRKIPRN